MSGEHYVFIYGSLKRGYHNDQWMEGTGFLGDAVTSDREYEMHACSGMFPLAVPGNNRIAGELYVLDDEALANLDWLEGNGISYTRKQIKLSGVDVFAWMYMYNFPDTLPPADGLEFLVSTDDFVQTWLNPEDYFDFKADK